MRKTYQIDHKDGQRTLMSMDTERAEAPISVSWDHLADEADPWSSTQYQTADARHDVRTAAAIILHDTDRESCAEDEEHPCDCAKRIQRIRAIEEVA